MKNQPKWLLVAIILAYALLIKLVPYFLRLADVELKPNINTYPWNFSPMWAVCLYCGVFMRNRGMSLVLPLAVMLASDLGIWALTGRLDWAFYPGQAAVYVGWAICVGLGYLLRGNRPVAKTIGLGFVGCTVFFIITNFATWATLATYEKTWEGLLECYVLAIPFYRNSLISTAFFGAILFSPLCVPRREPQEKPAVASLSYSKQ